MDMADGGDHMVTMAARKRIGSKRRAALPARIPRSRKPLAGRTAASQTPAHVRTIGVSLAPDDRAYIRQRLGMKLGKFAPSIERVSVRVEDINGPRGGIDKLCRVKVVLSGMPSLVIEKQHHAMHAAIDDALDTTARKVRRALGRRATPTRPRRAAAPRTPAP